MNRHLYGFFSKRLDEAGLDQVPDSRDDRGKRWDLGALLRTSARLAPPIKDETAGSGLASCPPHAL
jgi:hypothetical protein